MYVKLNGEMVYLWRGVDQEGEVLESYVTKSRDKAAALFFIKKVLKHHCSPDATNTEGQVSFTMDSFALRSMIGGIAKNPAGIGQLAQLYGAFINAPLTMTGMPELMNLASGISRKRLGELLRR